MNALNGLIVVFTDKYNRHMIMMPSGEIMPCITMTQVIDVIDDIPTVLVKAQCNLATDEEHARKIVSEYTK